MSFSVSFRPPTLVHDRDRVLAEGIGEDYETLVIEACGVLDDAGGGEFHIGGFGSDEWPLNVAYDLSAFMEQFPSLLGGVREGCEVEVDLYSQGIERTLTFRSAGEIVNVKCESRTSWSPHPETESIAQSELVAMLSKLAEDFAGGLKAVNSELSTVEPFARWLEGEV